MGNKQVKTDTSSHVEKREHSKETVLTEMNEFRKNGNFCDVVINVKNKEYPAHRSVLAAFSPYFKAMFSGEYAESQQSTVKLNDIDYTIMDIILEYAYTANIEISATNVQPLLRASTIFQASSLFDACCYFLEKQLNAENCISIYNLADMYSCTNLREKAKDYYLMYFCSVCQSSEFLELEPQALIDIISNDALNVENEELVFDSVIRWLRYKEEDRAPALPEVLTHVRLALLSPYFLHDRVETLKIIRNSPSCMCLVEEAFRFIALPFRRLELQSGITRPRKSSAEVEGAVIFEKVSALTAVSFKPQLSTSGIMDLTFISADGQVSKKLSVPSFGEISNGTILCCNQNLYAAEAKCSGHVWRYDSRSDTWQQIASMSKLRNCFGLASLDGYLYAVGGWDFKGERFDSVERYDSYLNSWTPVAPLLLAVHSAAVVTLNGMMYVLGGNDASGFFSRVQRYDSRSNTWTEMNPFSVPRVHPIVCALHNRIYVFGRSSTELDSQKVEIFNVEENQWEKGPDLPCPAVGAVVLDGRLTVVTTRMTEGVECYVPSKDTWQLVAEFPGLRPTSIAGPLLIPRPRTLERSEFGNVNGILTISLNRVSTSCHPNAPTVQGSSQTSLFPRPAAFRRWRWFIAPLVLRPGHNRLFMSETRIFLGRLPRMDYVFVDAMVLQISKADASIMKRCAFEDKRSKFSTGRGMDRGVLYSSCKCGDSFRCTRGKNVFVWNKR